MSDPLLRLEGITKVYDAAGHTLRWRDAVPGWNPPPRNPVVALDDVTMELHPGETVGVIGPNGAGKSTLLKIVVGAVKPTSGRLYRRGHVGSLIELGLGFHPEMTGWANIRCASRLMGTLGTRVRDYEEPIAEFSGLGDALDEELRTYSMGMRARLGFAVATQLPADILVVDEVLAVGDREFQDRCLDRIAELVAAGTGVIVVSHDMSLITRSCERTILIEHGEVALDGPTVDVVRHHLAPRRATHRVPEDAPVRLRDLVLESTEIAPWDTIGLTVEFETDVALVAPSVEVALSVPAHTPGRPFSVTTVGLEPLRAGRYRLAARTGAFPGQGAPLHLEVTVTDGEFGSALAQADADLRVVGGMTSNKAYLAAQATWSMEPDPAGASDVDPRAEFVGDPSEPAAFVADGVTKRFVDQRHRLRHVVPFGRRPLTAPAVRDVDLRVRPGMCIGVIGPNGSGKSTLLRLLAGITLPDGGTVTTTGRVVALMDLQVGFHPELTGSQNLRFGAQLLGLGSDELDGVRRRILDMSGLADRIDRPVRQYSDGQRARLGFALAVCASPDVLLVDELLAVGDHQFRGRAVDAIHRLVAGGTTVVFVSHELRLVEEMCSHVVRLGNGAVVDSGESVGIIDRYGGRSWAPGVADAGAPIRIVGLQLEARHIGVGGTLRFSGFVEVDEPSPWCRIEVSYRVAPERREDIASPDDVDERTFFLQTVEPPDGGLNVVGRHRFTGSIDRNMVEGRFDLVLAVVDGRDAVTISESWTGVVVGNRSEHFGAPGPTLDLSVEVEPISTRSG